MGFMLQHVCEQFMAGSSKRRMEVKNVGMKDNVAPLVSTVQGMAGEFRQMKNMVKRINAKQGAITRKAGEIGSGMTGQ